MDKVELGLRVEGLPRRTLRLLQKSKSVGFFFYVMALGFADKVLLKHLKKLMFLCSKFGDLEM